MDTSPEAERRLLRGIEVLFGKMQHVPIESPKLAGRVRSNYQAGIDQVIGLGFEYLCSDGEAFPLTRLLRGIPAFVMWELWRGGTPITVHAGSIVAAYPVLVHGTKPTFAHLFEKNVKFLTAFRDGTLLVSGNHANPFAGGPGIKRSCQNGTVAETWIRHQARVEALENDGGEVDRRDDYQQYVRLHVRDTASW